MSTIQQTLHIFRKDVRHLRFELGAVFLLLIVLVLSTGQSWEGLQGAWRLTPESAGPLTLLLVIAWTLLIARAIQTEALPGDRHFWLTRPYSRTGLLLSKGLFIFVFINIPLGLAQSAIILRSGIPLFANLDGLFLNQLLLTLVLLLPVAAIASLTRNLAQFLPAAVLVGGMLIPPILDLRFWGDLEWIRSVLGGVLAGSITTLILWRQYRLRRSINTTLAGAGAVFAGMFVYMIFPQSAAFAIQARLLGAPDGAFALSLAEPDSDRSASVVPNRYRQLLSFPLAVAGADPSDLRVESSTITFRTLSGIRRYARAEVHAAEQNLTHLASVDRNFFDAAKGSPVNLEVDLYLTEYGNPRSTEVPLDGTPIYVAGLGQCGVVVNFNTRRFVCRSAFKGPVPFRSDRVSPGGGANPLWDTSSAFRLQALVYPIVTRAYQLLDEDPNPLAPAEPLRPTALLVRDPVAYFRYTMEAEGIRLGDFALDDFPNSQEGPELDR